MAKISIPYEDFIVEETWTRKNIARIYIIKEKLLENLGSHFHLGHRSIGAIDCDLLSGSKKYINLIVFFLYLCD